MQVRCKTGFRIADMNTREISALIRMQNVELVSRLALLLKTRHPATFTEADEAALQDEARKFMAAWRCELTLSLCQ